MKNPAPILSSANLKAQAKIQILVHSIIMVLFSVASVVIYNSIKTVILGSVQQRAEVIANEVVDTANMLMVTGEISKTENRKLMIKKISSSGNIIGLRLVRAEQIVKQYGTGLPEEQIKDDTERNAIASGQPSYIFTNRSGMPVFRAVTPYLVSHDFHSTDCLTCHRAEIGSVVGASDIEIDLTSDFKRLNAIVLWIIFGQATLQVALFFLIRWAAFRS